MYSLRALTLSVSLLTGVSAYADSITGQWMIDPASDGAKVHLTLHRAYDGQDGHWNMTNSSSVDLSMLRGLTREQMQAGGSGIRFSMVHDAGTMNCEGYFKAGSGAGPFAFVADPGFVSEMRGMGYDGLTDERVFSMAVHDVSRGFVRDLRSLGVNPVDSQKLIALRIHGLTIDYVRGLRDAGYQSIDAEQLVAMKIHGVTVEFVKRVQQLGFAHPDLHDFVRLRIHGVTPEYIQTLQGHNLRNLTLEEVVRLKIHGVD